MTILGWVLRKGAKVGAFWKARINRNPGSKSENSVPILLPWGRRRRCQVGRAGDLSFRGSEDSKHYAWFMVYEPTSTETLHYSLDSAGQDMINANEGAVNVFECCCRGVQPILKRSKDCTCRLEFYRQSNSQYFDVN